VERTSSPARSSGAVKDAFFRHVVTGMRNGVLALDRDGALAIINDEAYRIFGIKRGPDDLGRPAAEVLRDHPEVVRLLSNVRAAPVSMTSALRNGSGTRAASPISRAAAALCYEKVAVPLRIFSGAYLCSRSAVSRMNSGVSRRRSRCGSIRKNGQQAKPVSTLRSNHAIALSVSPSTAYTQAIW
jgi:PAS domain-containing protein